MELNREQKYLKDVLDQRGNEKKGKYPEYWKAKSVVEGDMDECKHNRNRGQGERERDRVREGNTVELA